MLSADLQLVSWDVDGTLYPMAPVKRAVIRAGLRGLFSFRIVRNVRELALLGRFRKLMAKARHAGGELPAGVLDDRERVSAAERRWYGPAIERVGKMPGVLELIDAFAAAGIPQIAVSDYHADYKLTALGLADRFERVYAAEACGFLKPSSEVFHKLLADHDVAPERVLHIGDREDTDGIAARAAGCRVAIVGGDRFATMRHLLDAVERKQLPAAG